MSTNHNFWGETRVNAGWVCIIMCGSMCVHACARTFVRACVRECVCVCLCLCVCINTITIFTLATASKQTPLVGGPFVCWVPQGTYAQTNIVHFEKSRLWTAVNKEQRVQRNCETFIFLGKQVVAFGRFVFVNFSQHRRKSWLEWLIVSGIQVNRYTFEQLTISLKVLRLKRN